MNFIIVKAKTIRYAILMILVMVLLALSVNGNTAASVFFGSSLREIPIYNVQTEEKKVAISFDAAWGADKTQAIMDLLKEFEADATFFLVGFWVENYPDVAKKIAENGFEIGTHSNTHPDLTKLSQSDIRLELSESINTIKKATDCTPTLFRAPYGAYNDTLINVASDLNLKTIQWDVDSLDWKNGSASTISNRVLSLTKSGSIILCHNNADNIVDALRVILVGLKQKGYKIVRISDLIYSENYIIDHNGTQIKK